MGEKDYFILYLLLKNTPTTTFNSSAGSLLILAIFLQSGLKKLRNSLFIKETVGEERIKEALPPLSLLSPESKPIVQNKATPSGL